MNTLRRPINPWKFRLRIVLLITLLTLGLATAAIERWRQEAFDPVWDSVHNKLSFFLNPISERTYRVFAVAMKVDSLLKVEEQNQRLLRENSKLNIRNQRLSEELSRLNRLAGLGRWSGPSDLVFLSADVTGLIASGQSAAMIINRGREDGIRPRDPVVALGGLVGIVQTVSASTSRVQAILDSASAVGVMDRNSRARGVIFRNDRKSGDRKEEPLKFMPENEVQPINIGGVLITSGFENSVYPKGIIVGTIVDRKLNTYGIPYGIVKPAVTFESLEEVLLVIPRSRLTGGMDDFSSTATLGAKRIFMPSSELPEPGDGASTNTLAQHFAAEGDELTSAGARLAGNNNTSSATQAAQPGAAAVDEIGPAPEDIIPAPLTPEELNGVAPPTPPELVINAPLPMEEVNPLLARRVRAEKARDRERDKARDAAAERGTAARTAAEPVPGRGESASGGETQPGDLGQ